MIRMNSYDKKKTFIIVTISIILYIITMPLFRMVVYNYLIDDYKCFGQALKIKNDEAMFDNAIKTKVGNVLAEGTITAEEPIEFMGKKYISLKKITEEYTMHTRIVTSTVGKVTTSRTEVYYTWDEVDTEEKESKIIKFLNKKLKTDSVVGLDKKEICSIEDEYDSDVRYIYSGYEDNQKVTLSANTSSGKIEGIFGGHPEFNSLNIEELVESMNPNNRLFFTTLIFTIIHILITICVIFFVISDF